MNIAVFLSTYNGKKFLSKQLESLANQTMVKNITLYVRDDGSTDNTLQIIKQYRDKIKMRIIEGQNVGPSKSFWYLFMNSNIVADYYAFCDQDDIWDNNKIEIGVKNLEAHTTIPALWCSNCRIIDEKDNIIQKRMNKYIPLFELPSQFICGTTQGCSMLVNNTLREQIIQWNIGKFPMHDFVVITYAIAEGRIIYESLPTFSYRVHSDNVVANYGKDFKHKINQLWNNWFSKNHRNEMSGYAKKLLEKSEDYLDCETKVYLKHISCIQKSFASRIWLIRNKKTKNSNRRAVRSFKIRVLLGVY